MLELPLLGFVIRCVVLVAVGFVVALLLPPPTEVVVVLLLLLLTVGVTASTAIRLRAGGPIAWI